MTLVVVLAVSTVGCTKKDEAKEGDKPADSEISPSPQAEGAKVESATTSSYDDIKPVLSSTIPTKLELDPNKPVVEDNRPFFDQFSWQSFIALCWPADTSGERGTPQAPNDAQTFLEANTGAADAAAVVWGSYRTSQELFPSSGEPPLWNALDTGKPGVAFRFGKSKALTLAKFKAAAGEDVTPDDFLEATGQPLIDQNHKYAYYGININKTEYSWVREKKWYIKENIPNPATLPFNAIEIKSAWRPMITKIDPSKPWQKVDDLNRYYTIDADVPDPCDQSKLIHVKLGLVGLHIIQKTEKFTEWIWSTFEQVDNVSTAPTPGLRPSYNNGTPTPPSPKGYNYTPDSTLICEESKREPVQTTRVDAIPDTPAGTAKYLPDGVSTQGMNKTYQQLVNGTVWQYYQLVRTQWPSDPSSFKVETTYKPEYAGKPFPVDAANVTLETYSQKGTSCMQCHYGAVSTDFSFTLLINPRSETTKKTNR
jgi:hypothetical protein